MRHATQFALFFVAASIAVALGAVPRCIAPLVETPPDWKVQREQTRKSARESIERLERQYGDASFERWNERHRQIWRNARRILPEMGVTP